jgi:hypothetical protein
VVWPVPVTSPEEKTYRKAVNDRLGIIASNNLDDIVVVLVEGQIREETDKVSL